MESDRPNRELIVTGKPAGTEGEGDPRSLVFQRAAMDMAMARAVDRLAEATVAAHVAQAEMGFEWAMYGLCQECPREPWDRARHEMGALFHILNEHRVVLCSQVGATATRTRRQEALDAARSARAHAWQERARAGLRPTLTTRD